MKAKSIKGNSTDEIKNELQLSMADGYQPRLAIVFLSIKQDHKAICKLLDDAAIAVFGCTTNGEFINEVTEKGSVTVLLLDINKNYFKIYFEEYPEKNYREVTNRIAQQAKEKFASPAFFISGSNM